MARETPLLKIKIKGSGFKPGRIPVPLLVKICSEAQTAINRQAQSLEGKPTLRPGPFIAAVSRECTLELIALKKSSTALHFAKAAEQLPLVGSETLAFEAVKTVTRTMRALAGKRKTNGHDAGVLDSLKPR